MYNVHAHRVSDKTHWHTKHIDPIWQIVSNYSCGLKNRTSAYNGYSNSVGARFTLIDGEGVNSRPFKAHQRSFLFSGHCIRIQPIRFKAIIKGQGVYATLWLKTRKYIFRAFSVWNGLWLFPRVHSDTFFSSIKSVRFSAFGVGNASEYSLKEALQKSSWMNEWTLSRGGIVHAWND